MRRLCPEADGAALDRFRVGSRAERRRIVASLVEQRARAGLFLEGELALTASFTGAEPDGVVLDAGPEDGAWWRRVLAARSTAIALLDGVKIQFEIERPRLSYAAVPGGPSRRILRAPIPEPLFRIQRRHSLRVRIPPDTTLFARVRWPGDEAHDYEVWDLSVGGLGLVLPAHVPLPPVGTPWQVARLGVDTGDRLHVVPCGLTVIRATQIGPARPSLVGCALERVPIPSSWLLRELVTEIERASIRR